jgi:putative addiction module CopG family antidote
MNVVLNPELEKFVEEGVLLKRYVSVDAMVEEGLQLLREREVEEAEKLESLRRDLKEASDQIERGDYVEGKEVTVELIRNRAIQRLGQPAKRNAG